jgi:hypothetical protein
MKERPEKESASVDNRQHSPYSLTRPARDPAGCSIYMPLFTTTSYPLSSLVVDIEHGKIGLPDLQRPFVWPNVNVRNLFDSLYKGYPAGYLLFWETGMDSAVKSIGATADAKPASLAIVDGQQRLTSLYAVMKGKEVLRADFRKERIRIAFDPLRERFDVADASTVKDKAYIPDISEIWKPGIALYLYASAFVTELKKSREGMGQEVTNEEVNKIHQAISELHSLQSYAFTTLTLNVSVGPDIVAEVFVRINGEGKKLNQSDFIMTLMSVSWEEGRVELEAFARAATLPTPDKASPFNHFIKPAPDQMLRVSVGLGLKRARLENVYGVLRGRDAMTGEVDKEKSKAQFALVAAAQAKALNLTNWHHFLGALSLAGYRHQNMISSQTAIIYSYVLYLIGIIDHSIQKIAMRQAVAEFFFMASMTGRYTSSPETSFEFDIAQLRGLQSSEAYLAMLRQICETALTNDYWEITLPNALATAASRSPSRFAYQAALVLLNARALYSPLKVADMIDPAVKGPKAAFEQHHLFPRGYLKKQGITEIREVNQIANFAVVEWPDNLIISDKAPADYAPTFDAAMSGVDRDQMLKWHALPHEWWNLPYEEFLKARRSRMAALVRDSYHKLCNYSPKSVASTINIVELLASGESNNVEFKSTLRTNLHTGQPDEKMHLAVLKSIAGFMNAKGGTLLIGVSDIGDAIGLAADAFESEDKMGQHLVSLVKGRLGDVFLTYAHSHFEDSQGYRVLVVRADPVYKPCFVKDGNASRFYVRAGNTTQELTGNSLTDYVQQRFKP